MKREALLYEVLPDSHIHCYLCNHHCNISESKYGLCGVRQNIDGRLYTHVYGEVIANHVDPIEKKPFYHFLPGTSSYSIATIGCNFRCSFCQNWQISQQSVRDGAIAKGLSLKPEDVVREALTNSCRSISYTYTEPTVFFEYCYDICRIAKRESLLNTFVTNGYMTKDCLDTIAPYLDAANVDLKFFRDETYKRLCNGHLEPVLESIRYMKKLGIWVEITTLVVPGLNDSVEELKGIAGFIAGVGLEIPWHISRFHPDYKHSDGEPTSIEVLRRAEEVGKGAGLRYIYIGNIMDSADTCCYNCGELLIPRGRMHTTRTNLGGNRCTKCSTLLEGVF